MSTDWLAALPAEAHGLTVQRPVRTDVALPPGYHDAVPLIDPFEAFVFQTFRRYNADGSTTYGLPIDDRHDNSRGIAHGGLLMTFADSALGYAAISGSAASAWAVTVSQSSTFLRGVKIGELLEVTPVITRRTRSMIFTRGDFLVGDEVAFQAASVWKVMGA
jgi:acyl-coenzyme A thioesterase PaaI-like protein